jgi:hypothetical protein
MYTTAESAYDKAVRRRVEPLICDLQGITQVIDANLRRDENEEAEDGDELFYTDGMPDEYDALRVKQLELVRLTKHIPLTDAERALHESVEVQLARADVVLPIESTPLFKKKPRKR